MDDEIDIPSTSNCDNQEVVEEIEPFNFLDLPRDVQLLICRQLDLSTYIKLLKTSKRVRRLKLSSKTLLFEKEAGYVCYYDRRLRVILYRSDSWESDIFTWEQLAPSPVTITTSLFQILTPLVYKKFIKLSKLFKEKRLRADTLEFHCRDEENIENVLNLINIVKPTTLFIHKPWPDNFYMDSRLKSVTKLGLYDQGCGEEAFLSLKIPQEIQMSGTRLSQYSLRKFFLQLYEGKRTVESVRIYYDSNVFNDFNEIELSTRDILLPIWTEPTHHLSLFKHYPLTEVQDWNMGQLFYLFPCDSKGLEYYHVEFYPGVVEVQKTNDVYYGISQNLSLEILSKVLKKCIQCRTTYCEHRQEWSVARIEEKYPTMYNRFISSFFIAEVVVTGLCLNSTVAQAKWFLKKQNVWYIKFFGVSLGYFWGYNIVLNVLEMS